MHAIATQPRTQQPQQQAVICPAALVFGDAMVTGLCLELSLGACVMRVDGFMPELPTAQILLDLPSGQVHVKGEIISRQPLGKGIFLVEVRFTELGQRPLNAIMSARMAG
jgi:hypothetical protein